MNKGEVCFGAKNADSYGNFTITSNGTVIALKLVYISGFVTCNKRTVPNGSHWACRQVGKIRIIVTNATNGVIFPQHDYKEKAYNLPGYLGNSSELVFNMLSHPLRVAIGEEYRIWYNDDLLDKEEDNNDGFTCVDVYARYTY